MRVLVGRSPTTELRRHFAGSDILRDVRGASGPYQKEVSTRPL